MMKLEDVAIPREELEADPVQQARSKELYEKAQKYWDEHPEIHDITGYCGNLK